MYFEKTPDDKNAVLKALLYTYKRRCLLFCFGKLLKSMLSIYIISLVKNFLQFVEQDSVEPGQWRDAIFTGFMIIFTQFVSSTLTENLDYYASQTGHLA